MNDFVPENFGMFRELSPVENQRFRKWARDNINLECDPSDGSDHDFNVDCPCHDPDPLWHPVVRDEIERMKNEQR